MCRQGDEHLRRKIEKPHPHGHEGKQGGREWESVEQADADITAHKQGQAQRKGAHGGQGPRKNGVGQKLGEVECGQKIQRVLFLLDLRALVLSIVLLVIVLIVSRLAGRRPGRLLGRGPTFWAGAGLAAVFVVVGALAATDFDQAFTVFHTIFFPGKDNWLFDPTEDQIINILPQTFFMNCAILILAILLLGCLALILWDILPRRRKSLSHSGS